jgi:hypothetical protein
LLSVAVFAGHLCARLALAVGGGGGVAGTGIADDADVDFWDVRVVGVIAVLVLPGPAFLAVDGEAIVVCEFTDASVGRLSVGRLCSGREAVVERDARESRGDRGERGLRVRVRGRYFSHATERWKSAHSLSRSHGAVGL